jgi:hypothetical protein
MTTKKFIPVALMIAIVAALFVLIGSRLNLVLWVPFISWPLYFIAGAKPSRLHKEILGLTGGMFAGYLTILAITNATITGIFGAYTLPVVILVVAFVIVMLELTDWLELAPAYFFAFAGYFAYVFGNFGGTGATPASVMPMYWLLLMVGLALGYLTAWMRKKILEKEGVFGAAQETVFDKEKKVV